MPWVLYHDSKIQTRFMWFDGPNEINTTYDQIKILPSGVSMKLLAMHKGKEILVENFVNGTDLVIASYHPDQVLIEAVNYGSSRTVSLTLKNLKEKFGAQKVSVNKYLLDKKHNNSLTDPKRSSKMEVFETISLDLSQSNDVVLKHGEVERDGMVVWEIVKSK